MKNISTVEEKIFVIMMLVFNEEILILLVHWMDQYFSVCGNFLNDWHKVNLNSKNIERLNWLSL